MIRLLTYLPLLLSSCGAEAGPSEFAQVAPAARQDPVQDLWAEYSKAELEYAKAAQTGARAAHPAVAYHPRFSALLAQGQGRALLWLARHETAAHPERNAEENKQATWAQHETIAREHANAPWIREWARLASGLFFDFGAERVDPLLDGVIARCQDKEVVAELVFRAKVEAERGQRRERAQQLAARLEKDLGETVYGRRALGKPAAEGAPASLAGLGGGAGAAGKAGVGLAVGQTAPDFTTKDTDGVEFKLSDYRGKVVVIDFWGFW